MDIQYTSEQNAQILIALLKANNIHRVIISPGSTNVCFAASVQHDPFFDLYSSIDERSAAYMACGMAAEAGEPIALSCTGATASRNYMPGLTEAYYRHLPVLAITSTQPRERVGQNIPQVLDRSVFPRDIVKKSVYIETVHNKEKEWAANVLINSALIELRRNGGGPVHIDLETAYSPHFSTPKLPDTRMIEFYSNPVFFPDIDSDRVAIFVGSHNAWNEKTTKLVDKFCELYNGVVLCDHTSNYWGKYRILPNVLSVQRTNRSTLLDIDFLIHLGEMSGAYMQIEPKTVWRVHPDGEVRDTFKHLSCVFQTDEDTFFEIMNEKARNKGNNSYYNEWEKQCKKASDEIGELPFSNAWIASQSAGLLPKGAAIHFGILNSFRSWNFFEITEGTQCYCNTGGFGIDGCVSALIGASLVSKNKLFFGVVGDLAFFYDLNSIGNRHIGNNIRLIVVNNGKGNEFRNYGSWVAPLGEYADDYICAARHFGYKSSIVIKQYAEALGFEYFSAATKQDFFAVKKDFFAAQEKEKPMILEVFTDTVNESRSLEMVINACGGAASSARDIAKNIIGENGIQMIKKIIGNN